MSQIVNNKNIQLSLCNLENVLKICVSSTLKINLAYTACLTFLNKGPWI